MNILGFVCVLAMSVLGAEGVKVLEMLLKGLSESPVTFLLASRLH
jgi:hypothetical protein